MLKFIISNYIPLYYSAVYFIGPLDLHGNQKMA